MAFMERDINLREMVNNKTGCYKGRYKSRSSSTLIFTPYTALANSFINCYFGLHQGFSSFPKCLSGYDIRGTKTLFSFLFNSLQYVMRNLLNIARCNFITHNLSLGVKYSILVLNSSFNSFFSYEM